MVCSTENKRIVGLNDVGAFNGKLETITSKKQFKKVRLKTDKRHFISNNSLEDAVPVLLISMIGESNISRRKFREQLEERTFTHVRHTTSKMTIRGFIAAIVEVVIKKSSKNKMIGMITRVFFNKVDVKAYNSRHGTKSTVMLISLSFFSVTFNFIRVIINYFVFSFGLNTFKVIAWNIKILTNTFPNKFTNVLSEAKGVFTSFNEVRMFNNIFVCETGFSSSKVVAMFIKKKVKKVGLSNLNASMVL